tara:strand:- start:86298 stop:92294 length:5997 start_codon:yes stop_codon:yes gene_type:complete
MGTQFEEDLKKVHQTLNEGEAGAGPIAPAVATSEGFKPSVFSSLAAASDEDGAGDSIISSQLVRVNLPKERMSAYEDFFFPKRTAQFLPLIDELATISARTSGFFALLRFCLANARRLAALDKTERAAAVNREAERILKNVSSSDKSDSVGEFLDIMNAGNSHVIVPSDRYDSGLDIQFIGSPAAPSSAVSTKVPTLSLPYGEYSVIDLLPRGKANDSRYEYEYLEAYATELSQACVKVGEEVLKLILGEQATSYTDAGKRVVRTLPLNFDFQQINHMFFDHTGIILTVDFMENINSDVAKHFGEFLSANVIRTPKNNLIREVQNRMDRNAREAEDPDNPAPVAPDFIEKIMTREGMALSQVLSFSFTINLPSDIAHYITQAEEGERPSLLSLHNWASIWTRRHMRRKGARTQGGRIKRSEMPKFVLPLSKAQRATEVRTENGFHVEPGKGDDHNVFIAPSGALQFAPPTEAKDAIKENLDNYERDMEEYLNFCFEHGFPVQKGATLPREVVVDRADPALAKQFTELHNKVHRYNGKLLSYDWDYNNIITANAQNPTSIVANDMVGAATVDSLTLADYLGFNFAEEGEQPIRKGFGDSLVLLTNTTLEKDGRASDVVGTTSDPTIFLKSGGIASDLLSFYAYCWAQERVPGLQDLVTEAMKELGLSELGTFDATQLSGMVSPGGSVAESYTNTVTDIQRFITSALNQTMLHCAGGPMFRQMIADENEGASYGEIEEQMREHPHYFNPVNSPAADFGNLYNYVGGMVFKLAMEHLTKVELKDLFSIEPPVQANAYNTLSKPNFSSVSKRIMPLAVLFSKYVPNAEQILREADEMMEANRADDSLDESDIRVSGAVDGAQMFPHQVRAHQSLRKRPKFSILDIAPGGGKTTLGVTDIGSMVTELNEIGGKNVKPIILCPDGLIKNWVDDMKIFTGTKWNMIPVNKHVINRWGYEKLEELIREAPVNTIVVCGFNFLTSRRETVVFGTHSSRVSNNLEFMKRFAFDYICIDESHKLKNKNSQRHKTIKQLTTASHVRFIRLATGTLISNRVDDIVGQASLCNGHIFRDGEVSNASVADSVERRIEMNGDEVPVWEVDSPQRARQKLSRYASVITMKKKEWAFMLPSPIETFIAVPMVPSDDGNASPEDIQLGEMHKQLYDAVLQESVEELEQLLKKAKSRRSAGEDDEDEGGEDEGASEGNMEMEENEELSMLNAAELRPYLARIERLVTNPMADPLAPDIFGAAGVQDYHSTKARYIANRIDKHFNPEKWSKDKVYKEYTLLEHNGKLYLSRKLDKSTSTPGDLPETTRGKSPEEDTETWKEEPEGKVIVFCRYTNSVNGVFAALPEHYKRIAVKFTGEEDDKWGNLDSFLNDPKTKILVANEMGIAEGHNMQLASRIIRVESPWAPGDLDQSSSRIFRPDPSAQKDMVKNGKPGELSREAIFLDWILCDSTMEVAKQARLIAKIFNKARFDEAENETYNDVLSEFELDEIRMSLDTLRSRASLEDFSEYVEAYATLNGIQREEFHEMRVNMDHTMKDLEAQPEVPGSAKIQTPFVSNQKPEDPEGLQLVSLRNMLRNEQHRELAQDPTKLEGMPVVTDLGKGRIAKVRVRYLKRAVLDEEGHPVKTRGGSIKKEDVLDGQGRKVVDPDNPIVSFVVKQAGTNEILPSFSDTGVVFMPTKLDAKTAKRDFHVNNLRTTKTEERKAQRQAESAREAERKRERTAEEERRKEEERELVREERRRRKMKKEAEARKEAAKDGRKRRKNLEEGQPVNKGIKRVKDVPPIKRGRMDEQDEDMSITLHPAYFHGYLTLELKGDAADAKRLKKFGFKPTGPYAYVTADRYSRFDKVLDYLEDHFQLSNASIGRLDEIQDAFEEGPKGVYRMELAPQRSLPYFFATRKRPVQKRNEIRPYPIVMPNELQVAVDLKTNPAIRKHVGKAVPGAATKWQQSDGHLLYFASAKKDLRAKVRDLKKAGFTIENEAELSKEITSIRFRASSNKK